MVEVEFTKKFATKSKGDNLKCDSMLANHLIVVDKVAKLVTAKKESK